LAARGFLHRLVLMVAPIVLGEGVPLFAERPAVLSLRRERVTCHTSGVTLMEFAVGG
jgi:hypothetical protein